MSLYLLNFDMKIIHTLKLNFRYTTNMVQHKIYLLQDSLTNAKTNIKEILKYLRFAQR